MSEHLRDWPSIDETIARQRLAQRLLLPPDCLEFNDPLLVIEPEYVSSYSGMVNDAYAEHIDLLTPLDEALPFTDRICAGVKAYDTYRTKVPELYSGYWDTIDILSRTLGPRVRQSELSVVVAVGLEYEADQIFNSLYQYATQCRDPASYEVLLYLNTTRQDAASEQRCLGEIERFRREFPDVDIRPTAVHTVPVGTPLSNIKKTAVDIAATRWRQQKDSSLTYFLILNDADAAYLHPEYLNRYADVMEKRLEIDVSTQAMDMERAIFPALGADFLVGVRIRQYVERYLDANSGNVYPEGFDMALRPAAYCAAGGFIYNRPYGVDYSFGKILSHYQRGTHTFVRTFPTEVGIRTSGRRPAFNHLNSLAGGYNTRANQDLNLSVRLQQYGRIEQATTLEERIQADVPRLQEHVAQYGLPTTHPVIPRLFAAYGVKLSGPPEAYEVENASVLAGAYNQLYGVGA